MDLIIGLILLLWSSGFFVFKQFFSDGLTPQSMIQVAVAAIGALIILAPKIVSWVINFEIPDRDPDPDPDVEDDIEILDDATDYNDFKALNYLKDRAKDIQSEEAFELVVKLNTLIFSGEVGEKSNEQ
tara:strand:- start:39 stop:422 length:384 start_codon:yes stop_codon:yes gene_type:complete